KGVYSNGKATTKTSQAREMGEIPVLSTYTTLLSEIPKEDRKEIKLGLFQLISNRLFFKDKDPNQPAYHPRIKMQETYSYQQLDESTRSALYHLYNDYFYHRQESFWKEKALQKLPAIKAATQMLICGEDLGMVPDSVPGVMRDLSILSLEIQRMSKNIQTEFLQEADISYWSVCSPSTHDMSPIRAWWEEMDPPQRQRFYNQELGFRGRAPQTCESYIAIQMLYQHLDWPSIWAIFPLQDLLAINDSLRRSNPEEERINVPSNPQHYWRYRMHLQIEDLLEAQDFNAHIQEMLAETGRL
ncbi:MAG: 4-alpha-glucanotransferase, partial [Bacteroidota bacterium]